MGGEAGCTVATERLVRCGLGDQHSPVFLILSVLYNHLSGFRGKNL